MMLFIDDFGPIKSLFLLSGSFLLLAAGCASGPVVYRNINVPQATMDAYLQGKPAQLRPMYTKVLVEGPRNFVLNQIQCGLAAMELKRFDVAEKSFDEALLRIESVYADNEKARKARSLWYEEAMKDFKGEPYERSMAYCYRGILYLLKGDFQNARACFKSGVIQDAFAEEHQHRCDFALLIFLQGWASQCNGDHDLASAAYKEVQIMRPDFTRPPLDHNVLVIAETGTSPRKLADGVGHYELVYRRGKGFTEKKTRLTVGQSKYEMYPMEDVFWQASTRGGRAIDSILEGQIQFRKTNEGIATTLTDISGNAMIAAPLFENATNEIQAVSGALGLIGVTQMAIAQNAKPRADTRFWKNLPDTVHIFTGKLAYSKQDVAVSFLNTTGSEICGLHKNVKIYYVDGKYGLGWARSRSAMLNNY